MDITNNHIAGDLPDEVESFCDKCGFPCEPTLDPDGDFCDECYDGFNPKSI